MRDIPKFNSLGEFSKWADQRADEEARKPHVGWVFGLIEENKPKNIIKYSLKKYRYSFRRYNIWESPLQSVSSLYTTGGWHCANILFKVGWHGESDVDARVESYASGVKVLHAFAVWCIEKCVELIRRRDPHYSNRDLILQYLRSAPIVDAPEVGVCPTPRDFMKSEMANDLIREIRTQMNIAQHNYEIAKSSHVGGTLIVGRDYSLLQLLSDMHSGVYESAAWNASKFGLAARAFSKDEACEYIVSTFERLGEEHGTT